PFETRLFTDISDVAPLPPSPAPPEGYDVAGAKEEAARCLQCQCMECVKRCVYLQEYRGYPKRYAREIYNNLAIVQGSRTSNRMINSCSLCGQCERICPNGFSMRDLCLGARREMVRQNRMPPSAHDFALEDMALSNSTGALLRHAPGREASSYLFFPGCHLAGGSPGTIAPLYDFLRDRIDGVGLWLRCCGAPARWAGREDLFDSAMEELKEQWASMGSPTVITACTGCLDVLRRDALEIEAVSLWTVLKDMPLPPHGPVPGEPMALHDPCTAAEMSDVRAAVRDICSSLGIAMEELPETGERTSCCGFGGLQRNANEPLADRVAAARVEENPRDYLTYCAMCRNLFARAGKRTAHLLDFLFPEAGKDSFDRPYAGCSRQRDDRLALVRALQSSHWMEENRPMEPHESIVLVMDDSVLALLEKRRIVHDTVKRLLFEAERTGASMDRGDGTFIASLRPSLVTYWVEYRPLGDGRYEVLGAWSHRMVVTEGGRRP
ncbi:MAG TPA: amine oxidase, partial [Synergistaceae bacterium]|nr:amine oxidase [Synergistaceae bacterium]